MTDEETSSRYHDGVTYTLGLFSIACGFNRVTHQTVDEVIRRVRIHEEIYGPMLNPGSEPARCFTEDEIRDRVGMRTNATAYSRAKFDADAERRRQKEIKERAVAEAYHARQENKEA